MALSFAERPILVTSPSGLTRNRCAANDILMTDCLRKIPCQIDVRIVSSVYKKENFLNSA